jgi:hypothetical protein
MPTNASMRRKMARKLICTTSNRITRQGGVGFEHRHRHGLRYKEIQAVLHVITVAMFISSRPAAGSQAQIQPGTRQRLFYRQLRTLQ